MADFFSRLAERTLDVAPVARPTLGSLFSSENLFPAGYDDPVPVTGDGFGDDTEAREVETATDAHESARQSEEPPQARRRPPEPHRPTADTPTTGPELPERSDTGRLDAGRGTLVSDVVGRESGRMTTAPDVRDSALGDDAPESATPSTASDPVNEPGDASPEATQQTLLPTQPLDPGAIDAFRSVEAAEDLHAEEERTGNRSGSEHDAALPTGERGATRRDAKSTHDTIETDKGRPTVGNVEKAPNAGMARRPARTLVPVEPTTARAPWWSSLANGARQAPLGGLSGAETSASDESGGIASRRMSEESTSRNSATSGPSSNAVSQGEPGSTRPDLSRGERSPENAGSLLPRATRRADAEMTRRDEPGRREEGRASEERRGEERRDGTSEPRELVPARSHQTQHVEARRARTATAERTQAGTREVERKASQETRRLVPVDRRQAASDMASMMAGQQAAARRESQAQQDAPPPIRVTIGRIEIKAQMQTPSTPPPRQAAPERTGPIITLDNYLKQRNRRSR